MFELKSVNIDEAHSILLQETPPAVLAVYNEPFPISEEQKETYHRTGYIKLSKVLSGEALNHARRVIGAAVLLRKESDKRNLAEKSQYEQSFLQCGYLCWDFPAVKEFVFAKRFAGIGRDLMTVKSVRLWHDQALYKEPSGRITDMHQDISYWPIDTPDSITMWMALVDVPVSRGCLYFVPGSHESGIDEYVDIFTNPHIPGKLKDSQQINTPLLAGDATFHSGRTYHGARANQSEEMREAMTVIYIADGTTFTADDARNATHKSCAGLNDGDIVDTKYTPKLI